MLISGVTGMWDDTRRRYPATTLGAGPALFIAHSSGRGSLSRADRWKEDVDNECVLATLEIIRSATTRVQMGAGTGAREED